MNENDGGFSLLEMLAVISIIGILLTATAVSFDAFDYQSRNERRRFVSFVRSEYARALQSGVSRTLTIQPSAGTIDASNRSGDHTSQFVFRQWSIREPSDPVELTLTPRGPARQLTLTFVQGNTPLTFKTDRLLGIREVTDES